MFHLSWVYAAWIQLTVISEKESYSMLDNGIDCFILFLNVLTKNLKCYFILYNFVDEILNINKILDHFTPNIFFYFYTCISDLDFFTNIRACAVFTVCFSFFLVWKPLRTNEISTINLQMYDHCTKTQDSRIIKRINIYDDIFLLTILIIAFICIL